MLLRGEKWQMQCHIGEDTGFQQLSTVLLRVQSNMVVDLPIAFTFKKWKNFKLNILPREACSLSKKNIPSNLSAKD